MSKLSRLGSIVERALVGSEELSPRLQEFVDTYTHASGRAKHISPRSSKILNFALGPKGAANILRSRMHRGGIFGPGGILLGELAPTPEYISSAKKVFRGDATAKEVAKFVARSPLEALNPGLLLGLPAYEIHEAMNASPGSDNYGARGVGHAVGSGLGFFVGAPMGLVGAMGLSTLGGSLSDILTDKGSTTNSQSRISNQQLVRLAGEVLLDRFRNQ